MGWELGDQAGGVAIVRVRRTGWDRLAAGVGGGRGHLECFAGPAKGRYRYEMCWGVGRILTFWQVIE